MIQRIPTRSEPQTLQINVATKSPQELRIIIKDPFQANTVLTDRVALVNGQDQFNIGLPLCREWVDLIIIGKNGDSSFTYDGKPKKMPLYKRMDIVDLKQKHLRDFITFASKFAYNAGILRTNDPKNPEDLYRSDNWGFFIKYLEVIRDYETGEEIPTPARVDDNGLIEISKKYYLPMTVPGRLGTKIHEYSHIFLNEDADDESEADVNSLLVFRSLGFPKYEALEVWCSIMEENPTEENMIRLAIIKQCLEDFDNNKFFITQR